MASKNTVAAQFAKSLAFEVEATPQENLVKFSNTGNMTPLNVKIRVRKKDDGNTIVRRGMLSVPRIDNPENSEKLRLASSEQTIMSFNMLMEADLERKPPPRKPKNKFFGMCLGTSTEDDDSQYEPANKDISSRSDSVMLKQQTVLSKQAAATSPSLSHGKNDKYFGKCKPGGCLDPPFGEDTYAYEATHTKPTGPAPNAVSTPYDETKQYNNDTDDKENKQKVKNTISTAKVVSGEDIQDSSILSLYKGDPSAVLEDKESESIITYPPTVSSSGQIFDEEKKLAKRTSVLRSSRKSFNEFNTTYFSPPRTPRESKEIYRGERKRTSSYDPVFIQKATETANKENVKKISAAYVQDNGQIRQSDTKDVDDGNKITLNAGYQVSDNTERTPNLDWQENITQPENLIQKVVLTSSGINPAEPDARKTSHEFQSGLNQDEIWQKQPYKTSLSNVLIREKDSISADRPNFATTALRSGTEKDQISENIYVTPPIENSGEVYSRGTKDNIWHEQVNQTPLTNVGSGEIDSVSVAISNVATSSLKSYKERDLISKDVYASQELKPELKTTASEQLSQVPPTNIPRADKYIESVSAYIPYVATNVLRSGPEVDQISQYSNASHKLNTELRTSPLVIDPKVIKDLIWEEKPNHTPSKNDLMKDSKKESVSANAYNSDISSKTFSSGKDKDQISEASYTRNTFKPELKTTSSKEDAKIIKDTNWQEQLNQTPLTNMPRADRDIDSASADIPYVAFRTSQDGYASYELKPELTTSLLESEPKVIKQKEVRSSNNNDEYDKPQINVPSSNLKETDSENKTLDSFSQGQTNTTPSDTLKYFEYKNKALDHSVQQDESKPENVISISPNTQIREGSSLIDFNNKNQYDVQVDKTKPKDEQLQTASTAPPDINRESLRGVIPSDHENQYSTEQIKTEQSEIQKEQDAESSKHSTSTKEVFANYYGTDENISTTEENSSILNDDEQQTAAQQNDNLQFPLNDQNKYGEHESVAEQFKTKKSSETVIDNLSKQHAGKGRRSIDKILSLTEQGPYAVDIIDDRRVSKESSKAHHQIINTEKDFITQETNQKGIAQEKSQSLNLTESTFKSIDYKPDLDAKSALGSAQLLETSDQPLLGQQEIENSGSYNKIQYNKDVDLLGPLQQIRGIDKYHQTNSIERTKDRASLTSSPTRSDLINVVTMENIKDTSKTLPTMGLKKYPGSISMTSKSDDISTFTKSPINFEDKVKRGDDESKDTTILIDLALRTYKDKKQVVLKSLDNIRNHEENQVIVVKRKMKIGDKGILIPINSEHVMHLKVQSASTSDVGRTSRSQKPSNEYNTANSGQGNIRGVSRQEIERDINATISTLFDQELIPLHKLIKNLKNDINALAAQQTLLNDRLGQGPKRLRPIRGSHNIVSRKCLCMKY